MNQLIYVKTSIPSFYFETRPGAQMQARREWTREQWDAASVTETLATSPAVLAELARIYVENKMMPDDTEGDALHLALATLHERDILASWNCKHIANANKTDHVRIINGRLGHETPRLITPLEYLEQLP